MKLREQLRLPQHDQQILVEFLRVHLDDPPHRITDADLANHIGRQEMDGGRCARRS